MLALLSHAPLAKLNVDEMTMKDVQFVLQIFLDVDLIDPRFQIAGFCLIIDFADMRKENILKIFDAKVAKMMIKYQQVRHSIPTSPCLFPTFSPLFYSLGMLSRAHSKCDIPQYPKSI